MAPPKGKGPATKVVYIKKKGKGHGHHGGAWKVAYADFVTAMMALFMVLWLVSQTDETTRSTLSSYFRTGVFAGSGHVIGDGLPSRSGATPGGGTPRMSEAEQLEEARRAIEEMTGGGLGASGAPGVIEGTGDQVSVTITRDGLLVQITDGADGLVFGLSSSHLTPELEAFLAQMAPVLGALDNELQIHGHTDARPFPEGSSFDNWDLSFARADAARAVLERTGVRSGQIVGVLAHGPNAPLAGHDPMDPENRRLAILAVRRGREDVVANGVPDDEGTLTGAIHPDTEAPPAEGDVATDHEAHEGSEEHDAHPASDAAAPAEGHHEAAEPIEPVADVTVVPHDEAPHT